MPRLAPKTTASSKPTTQPSPQSEPKIAIVADWLTNMGGAEVVVLALAEAFPGAPIYTSTYVPSAMPSSVRRAMPPRTSTRSVSVQAPQPTQPQERAI